MYKLFLTATTALALVLSATIVRAQQIVVTGDISPATPPTQPTWTVPDTLIVGNTGTGTLTLHSGGVINAPVETIVANEPGSTGTLNFGGSPGSPPAPAAGAAINTPQLTIGAGGTLNFNQTDTLVYTTSTRSDGAINQIGPGTTVVSSIDSVTISAGTMRAANEFAFSGTHLTIEANGTADFNGFSQEIPVVTNAGLINFGNGTQPGTTLTMGGVYIAQGTNARMNMNVFLGADDSATDQIILIGSTSAVGHTALTFTNVGGPGAQTTGDGIRILFTTGGITNDAFTLANPELRAGSYDYMLFQGPLIPCPAPAGATGRVQENPCQEWFLRSTFIEETPPPPEPPPPVTPPDVLPPEPPPPPPSPGLFPIIGPEIATYGVVQPLAQQLGRAMLGTHDDRLGDAYPMPCEPTPIYTKAPPLYTKAPSVDCSTDGFRQAVWGRVFGQQVDNHYQAFADPRTDGQIAGLQVGFDVVRSDSLIDGHKDYGGLYFAYGNANVDVTGLVTNPEATAYVLQHTGAVNLNAYSGGAYWTHYGPEGSYVDLVLQGTSYNDAAATQFAHLDTSGTGFISSLETGYPIAVPQLGFGFVLEPQAQVLGQWINFDSGNDGLGPVALGRTSETTARLGLKGKWTITTDGGQVWQPYVRANVWSDFGGTSVTMFGPDTAPLISHGQYMDVDAGFTTKIDTHFSAFADAGYQFAVSNDGGGQRNGVKGTAGLRYQW